VIDFRYHLVSIVSIFLALAVGIVLGAGPLQGQIGDTLTAEITQLRSDKASLRTQVTGLEQTTADQSAFEQATLRRVVAGVASGRGVAIVSLPGAEADVATAIADTVVAAGGTVASRTTLDASWVALDDATVTKRDDLAKELATTTRVATVTTNDTAPPLFDRVLAAALTADSTTIGQDAARSALTSLVDAKFLEADPKTAVSAQLIVVVAPSTNGADTKALQTELASWVSLTRALDASAAGTVVAASADPAPAAKDLTIIGAVRKDKAAVTTVSSVDNAQTPMGLASVVLALAQQETGTAGHYGLAEGATAAFAPLPGSN